MYVHVGDLFFNGTKGVSEKNDCVGSFSKPRTKGRARPFAWLSIVCSLGKLWGRRAERMLVCLLQPRSNGLGSAV